MTNRDYQGLYPKIKGKVIRIAGQLNMLVDGNEPYAPQPPYYCPICDKHNCFHFIHEDETFRCQECGFYGDLIALITAARRITPAEAFDAVSEAIQADSLQAATIVGKSVGRSRQPPGNSSITPGTSQPNAGGLGRGINSAGVLYSKGQNNLCFTPKYAVLPLVKYIPRDKTVWCPFDDTTSEFVKVFTAHGIEVVYSHIANGQDYFTYEPNHWDILISNPPFTGKRQIFQRALSFNKPFALLMTNTWLNDAAPKQLFKERDLQLLMFEQRVKFLNQPQRGITFSSSYFCWEFLPKQIIMERLP